MRCEATIVEKECRRFNRFKNLLTCCLFRPIATCVMQANIPPGMLHEYSSQKLAHNKAKSANVSSHIWPNDCLETILIPYKIAERRKIVVATMATSKKDRESPRMNS